VKGFARRAGHFAAGQFPSPLGGTETALFNHPKKTKNFSGLFVPLCYIPAPLNEAIIGQTLISGRNQFLL
jgi:hypothetical protein